MDKPPAPYAEELSAHRNKLGYRGVERRQNGRFRAHSGKKQRRSPWFDTLEEAALAYDEMAREAYGERAYLNFPKSNENKVTAAKEGYCKRGHPINDTNTRTHHGKRHCRICNSIAQARRAARIKASRAIGG